jgi:hypothetical protein
MTCQATYDLSVHTERCLVKRKLHTDRDGGRKGSYTVNETSSSKVKIKLSLRGYSLVNSDMGGAAKRALCQGVGSSGQEPKRGALHLAGELILKAENAGEKGVIMGQLQ